MSVFLLVFFSIYGGMNLYVFLKAKAAFSLGIKNGSLLALLMLLMVVAPVIIRLLERQGLDLPARVLAYAGYTWMGLVFLFISVSVAIDLYRFALYAYSIGLHRDVQSLLPSAKFSFFLPLFLSLAISFYGYFEAWNIKTERVTVRTSKLPEDLDRIRVVQISDIHIGLTVREKRLARILEIVKAEEPDILVSTGDLVDGQLDDIGKIISLFNGIEPRYGKYAVTGNHEYYAGLEQALSLTEQAGFTLMRGAGTTAGGLNIAGVDYPSEWQGAEVKNVPEDKLLGSLDKEKFTLLLKHIPRVNGKSLGMFDLQLSGHTHKGQIFPFSLLARIPYPRIAGFFNLQNGSSLYVSRGSGVWGPPIRFLSPPEVTVIDIVRDPATKVEISP